MRKLMCLTIVCGAILLAALGCAAERPPLDQMGRQVKIRILVDKVMQPEAGWKTEEWMLKETADAGFNVFSPRRGAEDINEVRQVTKWCRQYGLYHMPWMRGTLGVPQDKTVSDGRRMVWANGSEQDLWSPNSDELWEWMAAQIVPYAELSATDDTLMGVFLDYENYSPGGMGNCYSLSYDDVIMGKFAAVKGLTLPALELAARKPWLEEQKLHEEFEKFQVNHWRERCRALRQAVDKLNPKFLFNIYPAPGTDFMLKACYPEWATKTAPVVLSDPWTYGRAGRYLPHENALKRNQEILERGLKLAREQGVPQLYLGGIDPVVSGADPEFSGKNALMLTGLSDGYWIFYEGPKYKVDHPAYFEWFTWANKQIEAGNFQAAWKPRGSEDPYGFPRIRVSGLPQGRNEKRDYPLVKLRGANLLLISARAGQPVTLNMQVSRVGRNDSGLTWAVKTPAWEDLAKGTADVETTGSVTFTPPADGVYVLLAEAGGNAYAVKDATAPIAIFADPAARFIMGAERLYFRVPQGLQQFTFVASGAAGETVKVTVSDPEGKPVTSLQTTSQQTRVDLPVAVPAGQDGKTWSLAIERADTGTLEDNSLTLDKSVPQALSYFADEVFDVDSQRQ